MRIGAIFARGSCRALTWAALVGVVFVLGAGQAAAQKDLKIESVKLSAASAAGNVKEDTETSLVVTLSDEIKPHGTTGSTNEVQITVTIGFASGAVGAKGNAEYDDLRFDNKNIASDDVDFTFLIKEGKTSGSVSFYSREDEDAVDEAFRLTAALTATSNTDNSIDRDPDTTGDQFTTTISTVERDHTVPADFTIKDIDTQEYDLDVKTSAKSIKEGGSFKVSIKADPPRPANEGVEFELVASDRQYTFGSDEDSTGTLHVASSGANALNNGYESGEMEVNAPSSDGNRESDTITISAYSSASRRDPADAEEEVVVLDIHALPADDKITAAAMDKKEDGTKVTSVKEGETVYLTVTVDRGDNGYPSGEALKVELMAAEPSQAMDFRISPASVTIPKGEKKQSHEDPVMLEIVKDEDIGEETLVLNLVTTGKTSKNGAGESIGMFSIDIEDATTPMVWAKEGAMEAVYSARIEAQGADGQINPGDDFDVMTDDLFSHLPDVTVDYAASSDNSSVSVSASGEKIMVMPQAMEGTAKITVTATATPKASSFTTQQTMSNVAQIMFDVEVMLAALTYTIEGPADMNLVEGMSYEIKATANRAVTEATMVELVQTDGTASPSDYTVENITIMAGETMGSTMLMVNADDMMESENNMSEMLTLEGRVGAMKTNALSFHLWDAAVPALPIIAQLLLAAFLAIGGYRRYLRR